MARPVSSGQDFVEVSPTGLGSSDHNDAPAGWSPVSLPRWAAGLAGSKVERRNDFGVLDHDVTLPSGMIVYNSLRVISDGGECEVVFTLRNVPN